MDRDKYTSITVTWELKRRLDAIAARNRRSAPLQVEHWCDIEEQRLQSSTDCIDPNPIPKHTTNLK